MRNALISFALTALLTACQSVSTGLTAANRTLADVADNDLPRACATVAVAQGYFEVLRPR